MKTTDIDLGKDPINKLLSHYIMASVIGMIISSIHSVIDTVFISRGVGSLGIAAINTVMPVVSWSWALLILFSTGGSTLHAIYRGKDDIPEAKNIFYTTVLIMITVMLAVSVTGIIFIEPICYFLGCTAENIKLSIDYIKTILCFLPFYAYNGLLSRFTKNDGNPKVVAYALLASALVNISLDYVFIFVFDWSMFGAALATGIAQVISSAILSTHFFHRNNTLDFKFKKLRLNFSNIVHITKTGLPAFIAEASFAVTLIFMNRAIRDIAGTTGIAALGIMFNLINFLYLIIYGISSATQPIIGYNHGAGLNERVYKTLTSAIKLSFFSSIVVMVLSLLTAESLVKIINDSDPALIVMATQVSRINFLTMPITALSSCVQSYYQSVDRAALASVLTAVRNCINVLICMYILKYFFGLMGIWCAYPVADIFTSAIYGVCFLKIKKRYTSLSDSYAL